MLESEGAVDQDVKVADSQCRGTVANRIPNTMNSTTPIRVAIFSSHPIQYQAPWFRELARAPGLALRVFFSYIPDAKQQGVGFGKEFEWDVPLLDGYDWEVLPSFSAAKHGPSILKSAVGGIAKALQGFKPDIALILGWHHVSLIQAIVVCRFMGIPIILRGESNSLQKRPLYKRLIHRMLFAQCTSFLAIGSRNSALYESNNVSKDNIYMARYLVDNNRFLSEFNKLYPARADLRKAWGIPPGSVCFCFVGKLEPKKRPLDFVAAFRIAYKQNRNIVGLVVGSGELAKSAEADAKKDNLPIVFVGFLNQSEISKAYISADAIVLPSDYGETWGLVINEAMVSGIPALVSDRVGCANDLVLDGQTGRVFPFGDIDELARCMLSLADDGDFMRDLGLKARSRVLSLYSTAAAAENTVNAVESTLKAIRHR
jgi:glycosyltransferase involved in cell wall biosynthesis